MLVLALRCGTGEARDEGLVRPTLVRLRRASQGPKYVPVLGNEVLPRTENTRRITVQSQGVLRDVSVSLVAVGTRRAHAETVPVNPG